MKDARIHGVYRKTLTSPTPPQVAVQCGRLTPLTQGKATDSTPLLPVLELCNSTSPILPVVGNIFTSEKSWFTTVHRNFFQPYDPARDPWARAIKTCSPTRASARRLSWILRSVHSVVALAARQSGARRRRTLGSSTWWLIWNSRWRSALSPYRGTGRAATGPGTTTSSTLRTVSSGTTWPFRMGKPRWDTNGLAWHHVTCNATRSVM